MKSRSLLAVIVGLCTLPLLQARLAHAEVTFVMPCAAESLPGQWSAPPVPANFPAAVLWGAYGPMTPGSVELFGAPARLESERRYGTDYWLAFPTVSSTAGTQTMTPTFACPSGWSSTTGGPGDSGMARSFTTTDAVPLPTSAGKLEIVPASGAARTRIRFTYGAELAPFASLAGATVRVGEQSFFVPYGSLASAVEWASTENPGCPSTATSTPVSISVHIAGTAEALDPPALNANLPGACAVVASERGYPLYQDAGTAEPITDAGAKSDTGVDPGASVAAAPASGGGCAQAARGLPATPGSAATAIGMALVVLGIRRRHNKK